MTDTRRVVNLIYRLFLFSWIFAVLWVKGYLWSLFGLMVFLVLLDLFLTAQFYGAEARESPSAKRPARRKASSTQDPEDGDDNSWREPRPPRSTWGAQKS